MSSSSEYTAKNSVAGSSIVNSSDSIASPSGNKVEDIFTPTIAPDDEYDTVHIPRLTRSTDAATEPAPRQPLASLPNIKLRHYPELRARRIYGDLYTDSYSDSDASEEDIDPSQSPVQAVVMGFERGPAKLPAVRVGAARLGEMMYAHHRRAAAAEQNSILVPQELAVNEDDPDTQDLNTTMVDVAKLQRGDTVKMRRRGTHKQTANADPPAPKEGDNEGAPMPLPKRLVRAISKLTPHSHRPTHAVGRDQPVDSVRSSYSSEHTSPHSFRKHLPFDLASDIREGEEFNGLLAPGAYADEKQRAKADGGKLQRLAHALRSDKTEREARLFRPVVFDPSRKRGLGNDVINGAFVDIEDNGNGPIMSKFPFCCCAARYCVAIGFVSVLLGAILGFFAWPRIPSISISSLSALEPAKVTYDEANSVFGLNMPLRINYEIHSGNFYPLKISKVFVSGFDGVTGNKVIDTSLTHISVPPLRLQFHSETAAINYLTSDMSDPALTDLFGKCAPKSAVNASQAIEGRPGALTIRFQIKVDVSNLGWLKQPIVTLNQNVECPE
ncbi:hypothetical protein IW152_003162 [Coemansia sp. BCRC 34962]|nr:hypothetical protein IW152_003162 [Coemansia sp. BCRC 34962]